MHEWLRKITYHKGGLEIAFVPYGHGSLRPNNTVTDLNIPTPEVKEYNQILCQCQPKSLPFTKKKTIDSKHLPYTQFIFEWPILSDRFWVLVYILRKIVTNSLFFSKNNIQVLVSRTNFFTNFFLDTYFFKLARDYTLNLP